MEKGEVTKEEYTPVIQNCTEVRKTKVGNKNNKYINCSKKW